MFTLFYGASRGFMKVLKAFIKPFETPQRKAKIKFKFIFILIQLSEMRRAGRVKSTFPMKVFVEPPFQ